MGSTSKMGIPYPAATDYVSDGATDMQAIADQVDLRSGLVKIVPTVSGTGTSVATNGDVTLTAAPEPYITCFTDNFAHYRITGNFTAFTSAIANIAIRLANGTTPNNTAANYRDTFQDISFATAALGNFSNNGTTASIRVGRTTTSAQYSSFVFDILSPKETKNTMVTGTGLDGDVSFRYAGLLTVATAYDGFNLRINGTSTLTGTIRVYGYN